MGQAVGRQREMGARSLARGRERVSGVSAVSSVSAVSAVSAVAATSGLRVRGGRGVRVGDPVAGVGELGEVTGAAAWIGEADVGRVAVVE